MKTTLFIPILSILLFANCKKKETGISTTSTTANALTNCLPLKTDTAWRTEDFKTNWTIQFPNDYEGSGMQGFEGPIFSKRRADQKVLMNYAFCSSTHCDDFGADLLDINQTSITIDELDGKKITLNQKTTLCNKDTLVGFYYYNNVASKTGKLFLKDNSKFKEALTIHYNGDYQKEVEQILQTLQIK